MHRRRFLQLLGLAGAAVAVDPGLVLDPDRALWVPGQKTIVDLGARRVEAYALPDIDAAIGAVRGRNTFLTAHLIAQEAIKVFERSLEMMKLVNREYDQMFVDATKVGRTLNVRTPARFDTYR
jgi:hypothetical protein